MPKAPTPAAPAATTMPTVSVAEAMGLPEDWSLSSSLNGVASRSPESTETTREDVSSNPNTGEPELPEMPETDAGEGDETPAGDAGKGEEKPDGKPAAKPDESEATKAAKTLAAQKGKEKDKAGKAEKKPGKEKSAPAPAAEAKPTASATPAATPAPAPAPKVKIGDKEYTPEELAAIVAKANAPAPTPVTPPAPAPVAKEPTPAEIAAEQAEIRKKDEEWISGVAPTLDAPLDEGTLDKILSGGKEAVAALQEMRRKDMARAILTVRRDMMPRFQKEIERLEGLSMPLVERQEQAAQERMETDFKTTYPHLADYMDIVNTISNVIVEKDPEGVKGLDEKAFLARVASETDAYIGRFRPKTETPAAAALASAPAPAPTPAGKTAAAPAVAPKAAVRPVVKPPGGNAPGAVGAGAVARGARGGDSDIIKSLL